MADFSYESDIAPMRGSYFYNDPSISTDELAQLQAGYVRNIAPIQDALLKSTDDILKNQSSQMAFERQKMDLEKSRDEARVQIEASNRLGELTSSLDTIKNDKSKDFFGRAKDLANLKGQYSYLVAKDPTTRAIFDATASSLAVDEELLKRDEKIRNNRLDLMSRATALGDVDLMNKLAKSTTEPSEQQYLDITASYVNKANAESQALLNKEERMAQAADEKERRSNSLNMLNSYRDTLKGMQSPKEDEEGITASLKTGAKTSAIPTAQKSLVFKEEDNVLLDNMILDMHPDMKRKVNELDAMSTEKKFRLANALVTQQSRAFGQQTSNTSNLQSLFNK